MLNSDYNLGLCWWGKELPRHPTRGAKFSPCGFSGSDSGSHLTDVDCGILLTL